MTSEALSILFLQLSIIFGGALLCSQIARQLKQPTILGELLAGVLLGSTILGFIAPNFYNWLFNQHEQVNQIRESFLLIGLLFFLFTTGMEVNLNLIRGRIKNVLLVSGFGILIPFAFGILLVLIFPNLWNYSFDNNGWILPLFIGIALSISALPVIARILLDLNLLDKELGSMILTSAVLNDLIGWALFAVCLNLIKSNDVNTNIIQVVGSSVLALSAIVIVTYFGAHALLTWLNEKKYIGTFIPTASVFIFGAAAFAEWLEIHPVFGAFLVGVVFTQFNLTEQNKQSQQTIYQIAVYLFAPLYFASVGLKVNFVEQFDFWLVIIVTIIAIIGKVIGAGLGARISGFDAHTSLSIGFGMSARGAMEIILAQTALENNIIDQRIFVALVIMALVTSMVSAGMLKWLLKSRDTAN